MHKVYLNYIKTAILFSHKIQRVFIKSLPVVYILFGLMNSVNYDSQIKKPYVYTLITNLMH